jgi:phage shock protein PspC (stress-responsive transcriptional regulator)
VTLVMRVSLRHKSGAHPTVSTGSATYLLDMNDMTTTPRLVRPRDGRILAGVCAGVADRFGLPRNLVRLLFVLSLLLPGPQILAYLVGWLLIPEEQKV